MLCGGARACVRFQNRLWMTTFSSLRYAHGPPPQHITTDENNLSTPFEFNEQSMREIERTLGKYPSNYKQSAVIPLLWIAQAQNDNWIPLTAMNKIAEIVEIHPMRVYEVATFYTMFNRQRVGKYHLQLCGTTPCMVCGAKEIRSTIEKTLHIHNGETTKDGLFTLNEVECLAACANAPMIQVNNEHFYENLTPETTVKLLEDLKAGTAKRGPANGANLAEGRQGRHSLTEIPTYEEAIAHFRDFIALKKELEEKKVAAAASKA